MYIDFKKSIWERVYIPKELEQTVKNRLSKDSLYDILNDLIYTAVGEGCDSEEIYETEEFLEPEQNKGKSTIEVYDEIGECIYSNSKNN